LRGRIAVLGLLALAGAALADGTESARYRLSGAAPWNEVRAVEEPGYRIALSAPDGVTLEARVEIDASALPDDSPFPPGPASLPADARALLAVPPDPDADALARLVTRGSDTVLEAIERVVSFTSRRIKYELPTGAPETAASCRARRRGSCVGRSLLAADLLARVGVAARQVTGILAASSAAELTPDTRAVYSAALGGVRHRWIEAYVPLLGWVPSDPGGLANALSARHVALARPPEPDFALRLLSRSSEVKWPALPGLGPLAAFARARGVSLTVRNSAATSGGSVLLAPVSRPSEKRLARTTSSSVVFERVPHGDYRVLWQRPDGRIEAGSITVNGAASLDLTSPGAP
jgi:transglutaminase superfamily protein